MTPIQFLKFATRVPKYVSCEAWFTRRILIQFGVILLLTLSQNPARVSAQSPGSTKTTGIQQQKETFTVTPAQVIPGDSLYFKYSVTSDLKTPSAFFAPQVRLTIRNLAGVEPSLKPESFTHRASYRIKPKPDGTPGGIRVNEFFEHTVFNDDSVVYRLPDFKADSTVAPDTLVFEFAYQVPPTLAVTCGLRLAGIDEELSAIEDPTIDSTRTSYGLRAAYSEIETEAEIVWSFRLEPEREEYRADDEVDLYIVYKNVGNVTDILKFVINLPAMLNTSDTVFINFSPTPSSARVLRQETNERQIVISDPNVRADGLDRTIHIQFRFRITTADRAASSFIVQLLPRCAPPDRGSKDFKVGLTDLLQVTKSASPNLIAPGEPIDYTITLQRVKPPDVMLDSVWVIDVLGPGISEIRDVDPPLFDRVGNDTLRWLLRDFSEDQRQIKFKAILRHDYYPAIVNNPQRTCLDNFFQNYVVGIPQQNEDDELKEQVIGNNDTTIFVRINPLGDVLRLGSVVITNLNGSSRVLPGDVLRFTVDFANVNTFAPSQFFTVCDTLPDRNYVSAPFDINQARAVYDPVTHVIRLDSLNFAPGEAGSLTFNVRVRDDIQICDDVPLMNKALLKLINGLDCNAANNALDTLLTITDPQTELRLALANFNTTVQRDRPTDFTINYNSGGSLIPLSNVTITAQLPQGMDFVSSDHSPSVAGRTLTWSGITILPSENKAIRVTVVPRASQPCFADTLRAAATITSSPVACTTAAPQEGFLLLPGTDDLLDLRVTANPETNTALDATGAPTVTYNLLVTNNSAFDAEELVLSDALPRAEKFSLLSASPGGEIAPLTGVITWRIARLAAGDSLQFSFQGNAKNRLYCAPDSLVNVTVLIATRLPQCEPEKIIRKHTITPTPPSEQPRLQITATRLEEARSDGAVEPYEPATFCVTLRADSSFSNLRFRSSLPNFSGWIATFGDSTVRLVPEANNPTALAAGETREFCFRLQGPQNISVDSAFVRGVIVSDQNCGQAFEPLAFPAKGLPILLLALTLVDSSGNNLATDKEILTANTTLQHAASSRFNAENVTLYLALRVETPANVELLSAYDAIDIKLPVALLTVNERERQWPVQFRYPVLTPQNQRIIATVNHTFFGFDRNGVLGEVKSAEVSAIMAIEHPCHARPRTFVPDQHHDGMSFQPNDGQTITIFDVAGNKVWQGNTRDDVWRGTKQNGEPALPGTYVWVISGEGGCKGTIVVLR